MPHPYDETGVAYDDQLTSYDGLRRPTPPDSAGSGRGTDPDRDTAAAQSSSEQAAANQSNSEQAASVDIDEDVMPPDPGHLAIPSR